MRQKSCFPHLRVSILLSILYDLSIFQSYTTNMDEEMEPHTFEKLL